MTREEAVRILHPDTRVNAILTLGVYNDGKFPSELIDEAEKMGAEALRLIEGFNPETGLFSCECGGGAEIESQMCAYHFDREKAWFIRCPLCGNRGCDWRTKKEAAIEWNGERCGRGRNDEA